MQCSRETPLPKPTAPKCSKCKKDSAVYLPYSESNLCKKHFLELFEKRFKRTNREFGFIKKGDKVAIGLSGGKDSTTLLYLLAEFRTIHPFELFAITIDSGLYCDYWEKTFEIASNSAKELGIPHYVFSFKKEFGYTLDEIVKKLKSENPCSICGVLRRRLLNIKSRELGATKLAIGHNLDDAVQTVLMNILKNEPMRLLRFNEHLVPCEGFIPRIKPLIRTPEEEVIAYAQLKGIRVEPKSCCPYSRFAMRNHARKVVRESEALYPGTRFNMFNSFLSIQELMKRGLEKEPIKIPICKNCGEPCSENTCMYCRIMSELKK